MGFLLEIEMCLFPCQVPIVKFSIHDHKPTWITCKRSLLHHACSLSNSHLVESKKPSVLLLFLFLAKFDIGKSAVLGLYRGATSKHLPYCLEIVS